MRLSAVEASAAVLRADVSDDSTAAAVVVAGLKAGAAEVMEVVHIQSTGTT